jgi:LmbE family N-acetylglucosaminyl deacetylase
MEMHPMNVTFVGAHQDDEMFCLGTLLKCRNRGDSLSLICVTNGDKGMSDRPDVPLMEAARIRDQEMRAVCERLRADYQCLGEPDEALYDNWEVRLRLIDALRHTKPDLVFTHFTSDYNLDHTTTSQLVFQCTMLSPVASIRTGHPPLKQSPPVFYVNPGPGYGFEATHFVDVPADLVEEMMTLMDLHRSQQDVMRRTAGTTYCEIIRKRLASAGERVGVPFAEAFRPCLASRRIPLANALP